MALLEVKNLTVYYGSVQALDNVSFRVEPGEIVAMIGPNGAGKSTALNAIAGVVPLTGKSSGEILFDGKKINNLQPYQLVKKGIGLVPEGRRIFASMTVMENLEMGGFTLNNRRNVEKGLEKVFNLFPKLVERQHQQAGTLSGGEQQMLVMGRALMLEPKLLLIDEPSIGLSPNFVKLVFGKLKEINNSGTSILLVEQNARVALKNSNRAYVFGVGNIGKEGIYAKLLEDKGVLQNLLGI
jgi:branched-chain amino acid transport system ATP-binding protein